LTMLPTQSSQYRPYCCTDLDRVSGAYLTVNFPIRCQKMKIDRHSDIL
jgi:hypothetical protein